MQARAAAAGIGVLLLLTLLGVTGVLILKGTSPPVLIGLLTGAALGGLNLALEAFSMSWALRNKPSAVLGVSLGGFALRLVMVAVLTIVFHGTPQVDATTFALTYVASFLAFVVVQVWVVSRINRKATSS